MISTMTLSAVRTAVGRQWLSHSTSSVRSSSGRLQHHVSLLALGLITSTVTSSSSTFTRCEEDKKDKKGFMGRLFPKKDEKEEEKKASDSNSSINPLDFDWSNALDKLQSNEFWDSVAVQAGGKMQSGFDSGIPTQLSYGFVSGYCSGMAFKKIGRVAAGVFGT
jgi:hypothetical protein